MFGTHCWRTWSSSQGAVALSSAEAEFYAMIEAVIRAKGLISLAEELGFMDLITWELTAVLQRVLYADEV